MKDQGLLNENDITIYFSFELLHLRTLNLSAILIIEPDIDELAKWIYISRNYFGW